MHLSLSDRGFEVLFHDSYPPLGHMENPQRRLVQASSVIGDYPDAVDRPGTSALWVGMDHHLNRAEVAQLIAHLQAWLATGSLIRTPG